MCFKATRNPKIWLESHLKDTDEFSQQIFGSVQTLM